MTTLNIYNLPLADLGKFPSSTLQTQVLNHQDNTKVGAVFLAPIAGATSKITKAGFYISAVAGTPGANNYKISLQGVDTAGKPNGTIKSGSGSNDVYALFTPSATGFSGWITLGGSGYSPSVGEAIAVVIEQVSTDETNYITASYAITSMTGYTQPMATVTATGVANWAASAGRPPTIAVKYANDFIPIGMCAFSSPGTADSWGSDHTPVYRGSKWTPQYDCRLIGVNILARMGTGSDLKIRVYAGTSVATGNEIYAEYAIDISQVVGAVGGYGIFFVPIPPTALTAGTVYRFVWEPTTTNHQTAFQYLVFPDIDSIRNFCGELVGTTITGDEATIVDYDDSGDGFRFYPVVPVLDQISITYPNEHDVRNGTAYGASQTGVLVLPGAGDVVKDVGYGYHGTELLGTFDEAARNIDPGEENVENGVTYKIANVAKEGSLVAGGGGVIVIED